MSVRSPESAVERFVNDHNENLLEDVEDVHADAECTTTDCPLTVIDE